MALSKRESDELLDVFAHLLPPHAKVTRRTKAGGEFVLFVQLDIRDYSEAVRIFRGVAGPADGKAVKQI